MLTRAAIAPFFPYIIGGAVLALLAGGWWAYNAVWDRGVAHADAVWEKKNAELRRIAAATALRQQREVDTANTAALEAGDRLFELENADKEPARAYYRKAPPIQCLTAERLRAIADSDSRAAAAAGGPQ